VAICGAIAARPRLLIADEPALGLSPAAADDVYEALSALQSTNVTTVIIETKLGHVEYLCPRAVVMDTGIAAFDGPTEDARKVLANFVPVVAERAVPIPFDFGDEIFGPTTEEVPHSRRRRFGRRSSTT
jgi:ABC-type glutathione transport system ATPase component